MKILSIAGARPNFMKIGPVIRELKGFAGAEHFLVHTGQHYNDELSASFFRDLGLPNPDVNLEVGSGTHACQTAEIMRRLEPVIKDYSPDLVVVVGDVNSTLAGALVAAKLGIRVAHVEAGLRSFDKTMPEEINRKVTDTLSDFLFVSEESGMKNLRNEGIRSEQTFLVGNVMIDSLVYFRNVAARSGILEMLALKDSEGFVIPYGILTLHRPSSVDDPRVLGDVLNAVATLGRSLPIFFPIHPRTYLRIEEFGWKGFASLTGNPSPRSGLIFLPPMSYLEFLCMMENARIVLTDSGGIQEETTVLGVPCLTLRENTERPVTIEQGTNRLVGLDPQKIISEALRVVESPPPRGRIPELWDGKAAQRIVKILVEILDQN